MKALAPLGGIGARCEACFGADLLGNLTADRHAEIARDNDRTVADAWAMIAWLLDQAAAPVVESFLREAESGIAFGIATCLFDEMVGWVIHHRARFIPSRPAA